jgi:sugar (pentulose or hexulose) kinase
MYRKTKNDNVFLEGSAMPKHSEDLFLVFDAGTQSMRAGLIDIAGRVLDLVKIPIQPYYSERKGWAEQRVEYYWDKFCKASQEILHRNPALLPNIQAVAITSHRGTYINLDKDGKPLRPAITWLDRRVTSPTRWAPFYLMAAFKVAGLYGYLDNLYRHCYSNWIREFQPDVWEKTESYLLLSGYLHYRLTGRMVESLGSNYGYLPVNRRTFQWSDKKDLIRLLFPIEDGKLPGLVRQGEVIGSITRQASLETSIPQGLPLVASACDKACEALGKGCLDTDTVCLSFGTLATVSTVTDIYTELQTYLTPYPGAVPGSYLTEIPVVRGFWLVSWFLQEFGLNEQLLAKEQGVAPEVLLDNLAKSVPPGSQGLVLQPYWTPFKTQCGDEGRGSIIGFTEVHSRAHLYRALLEGIIYALKDGAEITARKLKKPFSRLRVSGGGAQSLEALQIAADVFGLPVEVPRVSETGALGAAMNAAVGLWYYPDYGAAVECMTGISKVVQPIPQNQDIYDQLYHQVYKKMYPRLKPLYASTFDIERRYPHEMQRSLLQAASYEDE